MLKSNSPHMAGGEKESNLQQAAANYNKMKQKGAKLRNIVGFPLFAASILLHFAAGVIFFFRVNLQILFCAVLFFLFFVESGVVF